MTLNARTNEVSSAKSHGNSDSGSASGSAGARAGDASDVSGHEASPTEVEVVVVGTGFSGLGMAIRLAQGRHHDFVVLERAERRRRHLARQHLSGLRLRRAVAPLLVLVRAEPELVAHVRAAAGDPRVPRATARQVRRARRTSASATRSTSARFDDATARWTVRTSKGDVHAPTCSSRRSAALSDAGDSRTSPASSASRARPSTPRAGITTTTLNGKRVARDRHRRERDPVRAADRAAGRAAPPLPAHAAVDPAEARSRRSPRVEQAAVSRACRWLQRLYRSAIYWLLELRVLGFTSPERDAAAPQRAALRYLERRSATRRCARSSRPTTRSAASAS